MKRTYTLAEIPPLLWHVSFSLLLPLCLCIFACVYLCCSSCVADFLSNFMQNERKKNILSIFAAVLLTLVVVLLHNHNHNHVHIHSSMHNDCESHTHTHMHSILECHDLIFLHSSGRCERVRECLCAMNEPVGFDLKRFLPPRYDTHSLIHTKANPSFAAKLRAQRAVQRAYLAVLYCTFDTNAGLNDTQPTKSYCY